MRTIRTSNVGKYYVGQHVAFGSVTGFLVEIVADEPGASDGPGSITIKTSEEEVGDELV